MTEEEIRTQILQQFAQLGEGIIMLRETCLTLEHERAALKAQMAVTTVERDALRELMIEAITKVPQMCVFLGWGSQDPEEAARGVDSIMMYAVGRRIPRR